MSGDPQSHEPVKVELAFRPLLGPGLWQALLLPVKSFPMTAPQFGATREYLRLLAETLLEEYGLSQQIFLQLWKLSAQTGAGLVSKHAGEWKPEFGLGLWPMRAEQPASWSREAMMDASAAHFRGEEPQLPSYKLLRLRTDEREQASASMMLRGFGVQLQTFAKGSPEDLFERTRNKLLPTIQDARFKKEAFYLPLLDARSINDAGTEERLSAELCEVKLYVRESAEDGGILILTQLPLQPLLDQVQRRASLKL